MAARDEDRWPKTKPCGKCGEVGPVWWWDARVWEYQCPRCADPVGYARGVEELDRLLGRAAKR